MPPRESPEEPTVELSAVDEDVLDRLVAAAVAGASANEVTPPVPPGEQWVPERIEWLRAFHRSRRAGLDGPARETTWAVLVHGDVVGSIRLKRIAQSGNVEVGLWLTRGVRGCGVGRRALAAVLEQARALGAGAIRADTTATNRPALAVLAAFGFECTTVEDDGVIAWLALDG
ncbi:MAG TPA: GNAT family N-acetyltransferase [Blastococcus sp.]|nr:GNAT family N-acetyltransferase [Blastococcus sp.]